MKFHSFLVSLFLCAGAAAAPVKTDNVEAELVAERTAAEPGKTLTVALRLKIWYLPKLALRMQSDWCYQK